jgi:membrane-bound metal-dependent hydrolase YbcI (DUF457 family)
MFVGHFGVALAAKRLAPRASLGILLAAALLLDLAWPVLVLAGVERVRIDPGNTAFTPLDFAHYPWSHSALAAALWSAAFALVLWAAARDRAAAITAGLLVASHWVLDLVSHRPDLPLWPGGPKVGLGLWGSVPATLAVEGAIFAGGVWLYVAVTRARDGIGRWALAGLVALLALLYLSDRLGGPPPPGPEVVAWVGVAAGVVFLPWAAWADRHRTTRRGLPRSGRAPGRSVNTA